MEYHVFGHVTVWSSLGLGKKLFFFLTVELFSGKLPPLPEVRILAGKLPRSRDCATQKVRLRINTSDLIHNLFMV